MHRHRHHGGVSHFEDEYRAYYMGRHGHHRFGHFAGGFTGSMGMGGRAFRGRDAASPRATCSWCCWRCSPSSRATATS